MIEIPITTRRLTIRRFQPHDLSAFLHFMLDEDSTRYLAFAAEQKTEAGAKALFDAVSQAYDTSDPIHAYVIADTETAAYVGSCGFSPYEDGVVECYYCVNGEHRGRGFAVEAMQAVVPALAESVEVRAYCHFDNAAAHAVAKKCGMQCAGRARHRHTGLDGEVFVFTRGR